MDSNQKPLVPPRDAVFAYYPVEVPPRDDEIRLVDLWLVLVRRKAVFFVVAGLILAAGVAYALLAPPKYRYSALIELGLVPTASGVRAVEGAQTALAKINEAFLPAVLADYLKIQPEGTKPPKIRASIPKGSEALMLEAEGPVDEGPTLMSLQAGVIARLAEDHANFVDAQRRSLKASITAARNQLDSLKSQGVGLETESKRIEALAAILSEQRADIKRHLEEAATLEQRLFSADAASRDAAAVLQANVETRALRDQLLALDERLATVLPKQLDDIRRAAGDNGREILAQQETITDLEARLKEVRETRAIMPPAQSLEKVGTSKRLVMFVALFLAIFSAVLTVSAVESIVVFRAALRRKAWPETS